MFLLTPRKINLGDFRKRIYQGQIPPLRGGRGVWNYWHEHKHLPYPPSRGGI